MYEICTNASVAELFKEFIFPIIMRCHTRLTNFDNVKVHLRSTTIYHIALSTSKTNSQRDVKVGFPIRKPFLLPLQSSFCIFVSFLASENVS
ncbi:hypothetical protein T4D_14305 [Trichinella pseudospiralis]|uniref:Uncharacterized protein n=1 Tax=Trichinella pseudospiralis TaxID=6337 RepID=A0A0V1G555_TRIPS|nr:hypothetical protein T4D_14305 [Trichinella pseudospiralis]